MAADTERLRAQGERIKELRGAQRLLPDGRRHTQDVVADAVGVTLRAYQEWESGRGDIGPRNLQKLADYFNVTPDFIEYGRAQSDMRAPVPADELEARLAAQDEMIASIDAKLEKTLEWLRILSEMLAARQAADETQPDRILKAIEDYTARLGREVGKRPPRSHPAKDPTAAVQRVAS